MPGTETGRISSPDPAGLTSRHATKSAGALPVAWGKVADLAHIT
ncbi:hypothetical protein [Streptomyces sp. NPDC002403]